MKSDKGWVHRKAAKILKSTQKGVFTFSGPFIHHEMWCKKTWGGISDHFKITSLKSGAYVSEF